MNTDSSESNENAQPKEPEKTQGHLRYSRQYQWQMDHREKGLCYMCCSEAVRANLCEKHWKKVRERARSSGDHRARKLNGILIDDHAAYEAMELKIVNMYERGASAADIAEDVHESPTRVYHILRRHNVKFRPPGRRPK